MMTKFTRLTVKSLFALVLILFSLHAKAVVIMAGSDYLQTQPGTFIDFGFPGSPLPGLGIVDLMGVPIGPGQTDTIVQRLDDADLPTPAASDTIDIELVALSLRSVAPVDIGGDLFDLNISLGSTPSVGQMTLDIDASMIGGVFFSNIDVFFDVDVFMAGTTNLVQTITGLPPLQLVGSGQWTSVPPPDSVIVEGAYGDLNANLHTPAPPDHLDFFVVGDLVEEHPGVGAHVASNAQIPEPHSILLLVTGIVALRLLSKTRY